MLLLVTPPSMSFVMHMAYYSSVAKKDKADELDETGPGCDGGMEGQRGRAVFRFKAAPLFCPWPVKVELIELERKPTTENQVLC